jgi:hypothetical protein
MRHAELLNSLRKGDKKTIEQYGSHPMLLNSLLNIAQHPVAWKPGMERELMNSNGSVNQSSLGYQYTIQTTTLIAAETISQKFYEEAVADFAPVLVGRGPWMEDIKTNLTFDAAGPFESGIQDLASRDQIGNVEVGMSPINAKIATWAKGYMYSLPEIQKALASNNWDVVAAKYKALTKNWQLGIQKVGFLGRQSDLTNFPGLLSNPGVNVNNSFIGGPISDMDATAFQSFVAGIIGLYLANANDTRYPNRFVMPRADFVGLAAPVSATFPMVSKLEYLEKAFKAICGPDFKILCTAYANKARNAGYWAVAGTSRYVLFNADRETIHMDIPVDLFINAPATGNNFQWQGVGAGQFTGMIVYRAPEVLYFDDASSI